MSKAFVQGIGYKPPLRGRMSESLLDNAFWLVCLLTKNINILLPMQMKD